MLDYREKILILKNAHKLKGTGIYINEDFSRETTEIRKRLWNDVIKLTNQGKNTLCSDTIELFSMISESKNLFLAAIFFTSIYYIL